MCETTIEWFSRLHTHTSKLLKDEIFLSLVHLLFHGRDACIDRSVHTVEIILSSRWIDDSDGVIRHRTI
jgi:hypothetical protein